MDTTNLVGDRYLLGELLGSGGMADVYRATDTVLGRDVAVKLLRSDTDPGQAARFHDEARTLARLQHPGLVNVLDAGEHAGRPYLVMGLVVGATLADELRRSGRLEPDCVARIGAEIAEALDHVHAHGVVHRDVKPSNIVVREDGRAVLADFGIAQIVDSPDEHTRTGDVIGSPPYLAPEQVTGGRATPAVDIYALGLVLVELISGTRAFPGGAVESAIARLTSPPPVPEDLDPGWRDLLVAMTAIDPAARPSAAAVARICAAGPENESAATAAFPVPTMALALAGLAQTGAYAGAATGTVTGTGQHEAGAPRRRHRNPLVVAGGLVAATALAVALATWPHGPAESPVEATPASTPTATPTSAAVNVAAVSTPRPSATPTSATVRTSKHSRHVRRAKAPRPAHHAKPHGHAPKHAGKKGPGKK